MRSQGSAQRLTIFIGESDRYQHHALSTEIVRRAQEAGLAGCSVFNGVEGFGASRHLHTSRLLSLSEDLPVAIVIVDERQRIQAFLPQLDELIAEGLVIVDDVDVVRYVGRAPAARDLPADGR
jgi:PII-like signaling protein